MTSYLVPYSGERVYTYTASVNSVRINFLLPDQAGISLQGAGLVGPESTTLQDGTSYMVYSYTDLKAGQTLNVTLTGKPNNSQTSKKTDNLIAIVTALLGFVIIGVGLWWWRRPESTQIEEDEITTQANEASLDELIAEIARLDEAHEQGGPSSEKHQRQRQELMQRAKRLL